MKENKYPSIEFTKELWYEILPIVRKWGCDINSQNDISEAERIVSNFGNSKDDKLIIGHTVNTTVGELRYLVKTKEEFLSGVAKLLGINYNTSTISLKPKSNIKLNFKL